MHGLFMELNIGESGDAQIQERFNVLDKCLPYSTASHWNDWRTSMSHFSRQKISASLCSAWLCWHHMPSISWPRINQVTESSLLSSCETSPDCPRKQRPWSAPTPTINDNKYDSEKHHDGMDDQGDCISYKDWLAESTYHKEGETQHLPGKGTVKATKQNVHWTDQYLIFEVGGVPKATFSGNNGK